MVQLSHPYVTTGKTIALTVWTFVSKVNTLSRFVIAFLPRSKCLPVSWLQLPSSDFGVQEEKICHCFHFFFYLPWSDASTFSSICHEMMGPDAMILVFWMLSFKPTFSLSSFTFVKSLFSSSLPYAIREIPSTYLRLLIFLPAILIPAWASSSLAFHMMCSACKLNRQWQHTALSFSFPNFKPGSCSM